MPHLQCPVWRGPHVSGSSGSPCNERSKESDVIDVLTDCAASEVSSPQTMFRPPRTRCAWVFLAFFACSVACAADLPDPRLTPGARDPAVDQSNIGRTICHRGYAQSVRPPRAYTDGLKRGQIRQYRYPDRDPRLYEEDHLIPLSLGGAPTDQRNLWPEPRIGAWNAARKDELEFVLYKMVCGGRISLAQAQREIASDWIEAWKRFVPAAPPAWVRTQH